MKKHTALIVAVIGLLTAGLELLRSTSRDRDHAMVAGQHHLESNARWEALRSRLGELIVTVNDQDDDIEKLMESIGGLKATVEFLSQGRRKAAREVAEEVEEEIEETKATRANRSDKKRKPKAFIDEPRAPPREQIQKAAQRLYENF